MEWPDLTPDPQLLERIRTRPAMYFGMTGSRGNLEVLSHLIDEAVGRHVDGIVEAIEVRLHEDQSFSVTEALKGIGAERIFETVLDQCRVAERPRSALPPTTFECRRSWVSAAAAKFELTASTREFTLSQSFEKGHPAQHSRKSGTTCPSPTLCTRWLPDPEVMESQSVPVDRLNARLRTLSYLTPRLPFTVATEGGNLQRFYSQEGLADYLRVIALDRMLRYEVIRINGVFNDAYVDIAFVHAHCADMLVAGYANHRITTDGGSHLDGLRDGLRTALTEIGCSNNPCRAHFPEPGVGIGLFAAVSVRCVHPVWVGCTKSKLHNPEIKPLIADSVLEAVRRARQRDPEAWKRVASTAYYGYDSCG